MHVKADSSHRRLHAPSVVPVRQPVYRFWKDRRPQPILHLRAPAELEWNRLELEVPDLAAGLEGLRILHVTDLHFRANWSPAYDRIIQRINSDPPDLLVMTGDFLDVKHRGAEPAIRFARRFFQPMTARLGKFAIFGNHDYRLLNRWGRHLARQGVIPPEPWPRLKGIRRPIEEGGPQNLKLEEDQDARRTPLPPNIPGQRLFGLRLLDNEREVLRHNGRKIEVVGFRGADRSYFDMELLRQLPAREAGTLRLVLSHQPDNVRLLQRIRPDVVFSGHTHGGQICLPGGRAIITHDSLPRKCCAGIHRWDDSWLVISRGLGFSTLPLRVFCPPEVLDVTLVAMPSA